jgi:IclR family acetate operon transcriptional repressor
MLYKITQPWEEPMPVARRKNRTSSAKSKTVERAGLILACFTEPEPHLTLTDLAAKLELNPSTVYRYIASLQGAGLLERDARQGGYRLGFRVIELAGIALNQIEARKHALDEMDRLCDELNLLTNLAVLFEGDVMHLAHSAPKEVPRMYTALGRRAVAHCTALGKVLLAHRPWEEVKQIVRQYGWRPYTPHSIQSFDRLQTELTGIRKQGYSLDREERRLGVGCIAAPVRERSGQVVAALSVSGAIERLIGESGEFSGQILRRVLEAANRVSFRLGYQGTTAYL